MPELGEIVIGKKTNRPGVWNGSEYEIFNNQTEAKIRQKELIGDLGDGILSAAGRVGMETLRGAGQGVMRDITEGFESTGRLITGRVPGIATTPEGTISPMDLMGPLQLASGLTVLPSAAAGGLESGLSQLTEELGAEEGGLASEIAGMVGGLSGGLVGGAGAGSVVRRVATKSQEAIDLMRRLAQSKRSGGFTGMAEKISQTATKPSLPESIVGRRFRGAEMRASRAAEGRVRTMFENANELVDPSAVRSTNLIKSAIEEISPPPASRPLATTAERRMEAVGRVLESKPAAPPTVGGRSISGFGGDAQKQILSQLGLDPDNLQTVESMSFRQLSDLRRRISVDLHTAKAKSDDFNSRILQRILTSVDDTIKQFGDEFPDAVKQHQRAVDQWRRTVAPFFTKSATLRQIADTAKIKPDFVVPRLLDSDITPTQIQTIKRGLGPDSLNVWDSVETAVMERFFNNGINPITGVFEAEKFLPQFKPETMMKLKSILKLENFTTINTMISRFQQVMRTTAGVPSVGVARMFGILQIGKGVMSFNPLQVLKGSSFLISPRLFSKAINTRNGAMLIDAAMNVTPGTPEGFAIATRLAGFLTALNQQINSGDDESDVVGDAAEADATPGSIGAVLGGLGIKIPGLRQ